MPNFSNTFLQNSLSIPQPASKILLSKILDRVRKEAPIHEISALVRQEPEISACILRMANSAYFGARKEITSIDNALLHIGTREFFKMTGVAVINDWNSLQYKAYPFNRAYILNISLATAIFMEINAEKSGIDPLVAYTTGLLHNIGKRSLDAYVYKHASFRIPKLNYFKQAQWEFDKMGLSHAGATNLLLKNWEFPYELREPIKCQFRPDQAKQHSKHSALLNIAIRAGAEMTDAELNAGLLDELSDEQFEYLNLTKNDFLASNNAFRQRFTYGTKELSVA